MTNNPVKVGGIILDNKQNLLIVLGKYSQKWGVPKGSLEDCDESYLKGALREIKEETGLKLSPVSTKNLEYWSVNRARLYLLQIDEVQPKLKPTDQSEILTAIWLDLNNKDQIAQIKENANKMLLSVLKKIYQCLDAANPSSYS